MAKATPSGHECARQGGTSGFQPLKVIYDPANLGGEVRQGLYDEAVGEWLTIGEKYCEARGEIWVIFKDRSVGPIARHPTYNALVFEADCTKSAITQGDCGDRVDRDTKTMESYKIVVPSRIRGYLVDYSNDLWSGEIKLSVTDGGFKTVRVAREWELDAVADKNAEGFWNGFVAFEKEGSFAGFGIFRDTVLPGGCEKIAGFGVEVVDVLFGAPDL